MIFLSCFDADMPIRAARIECDGGEEMRCEDQPTL
jgi:hypothetical protein